MKFLSFPNEMNCQASFWAKVFLALLNKSKKNIYYSQQRFILTYKNDIYIFLLCGGCEGIMKADEAKCFIIVNENGV